MERHRRRDGVPDEHDRFSGLQSHLRRIFCRPRQTKPDSHYRCGHCVADANRGRAKGDRREALRMEFSADEQFALACDHDDRLGKVRDRFAIPVGANGKPLIYFCGNSLGLMPKTARAIVEQELDDWAKLGVDAHLEGATPWYSYHETVREPLARLVGAQPHEVVAMNSLTVNLHLMLATFYRPNESRFKILMESPAFPSDTYAIKSQIEHHGFDPDQALITTETRCEDAIEQHRDELALVLIGGVNFFSGRFFDIPQI